MIKTYENWKGDLNQYLQIGDQVDEEMYMYFLEVLPPACNKSNLIQIGEPYSVSNEEKEIYSTLEKSGKNWVYRGHCHIGDNEHQESKY